MTEPTMIERVARALFDFARNPPGGYDILSRPSAVTGGQDWRQFIPTARIAVSAMREPSYAACRAGGEAISAGRTDDFVSASAVAEAWYIMIDAALGEDDAAARLG